MRNGTRKELDELEEMVWDLYRRQRTTMTPSKTENFRDILNKIRELNEKPRLKNDNQRDNKQG